MITLDVPLQPPTFLQLTIFICLLLLPLLITSVPTGPTALAAAAAVTTDEGCEPEAEHDNVDTDAAAVGATWTPDRNEEEAVMPADHEVCLTTITPGRHCWCCWRICDAVCWVTGVDTEESEGEGLQPPAASATVGVIETDTMAGLPLILLGVLLEGMMEEEVVEEGGAQVPADGGDRNVRYGSN